MTTKTNSAFVGLRVTLLDGTKDRIAKKMKTGYKTEGGVTIKAANVAKKGRGLVELDAGGAVTPKSKPARRGKASTKKADAKPSKKGKSAKASKKVDASAMTRRELVTAMVESGQFSKRNEAAGIPIDDLRDMVSGGGAPAKKASTKKAKAEKSAASEKKVTRRRATEKKADKKPSKKSRASDSKSKTQKPVKKFTDKLARTLETQVEAHIAKFLQESTGYELTVACVGGVFNEERLTLQIGLLPTNASDEDIQAYAADMEEAEESETADVDSDEEEDEEESDVDTSDFDELVEQMEDLTGEDESKIRKAMEAFVANFDDVIEPKLGDEVEIGTRLEYGDGEAVVIGYSDKKEKIILFVEEENKLKLITLEKVARLEIIEDEEDEEDLDEEALDMDTEEEEFDEEEGDEDEDEDDDLDEEDEDEDEDEDEEDEEDEDEDDGFDDFDDEL
jgi:HIV Tat-specific factor 1